MKLGDSTPSSLSVYAFCSQMGAKREPTSGLEPLSCSLGLSSSTVERRARAFPLSSRQLYLPGSFHAVLDDGVCDIRFERATLRTVAGNR
jgi:hypothetical protein